MIKNFPAKVEILGTIYTIKQVTEQEDPRIEGNAGFTDWTTKTIALEKPEPKESNLGKFEVYANKVLRHEIIHAFLYESGLHECATFDDVHFEQMVDFFAIQTPKIWKVFQELKIDENTNTVATIFFKDLLLKVQDTWEKVREMGGTDAKKGTYDDGWDQAIKSVDEVFTETFGDDLNAEPYEGDPKNEK
jgi:hypothetical protein